jgi:1-aminocyclopropane-1-carboxylate deaminase
MNLRQKGCQEILTKADLIISVVQWELGDYFWNCYVCLIKGLRFPALKGDFLKDEIRSFVTDVPDEVGTDNGVPFWRIR